MNLNITRIYFFVITVSIFVINFFITPLNYLALFLPLIIILIYFFSTGLFSKKYKKTINDLVENPGNLINLSQILEAKRKEGKIPQEEYASINEKVVKLEGKLLGSILLQKKLFFFSLYLIPVFPFLVSLIYLIFSVSQDNITIIVAYIASFLLSVVSRFGLININKTIEKIGEKLKKAFED